MKDYGYAKQVINELEERYIHYIKNNDLKNAMYVMEQIEDIEDYYYND